MVWCFWLLLGSAVFTYAGYPLLIGLLGWMRPRAVRGGDVLPHLSVLIPAYNEERCIAETIRDKLQQDYPADRLEVLVISDACTDRTESIVREIGDPRVRLLVQERRQGKTVALNRAAREARGEILVFADANSLYGPGTLRYLARTFADPSVGYTTGRIVYTDATGSLVGDGCNALMRYENLLRSWETRAGSIVGVDGAVDAMRGCLYEPVQAEQPTDVVLPLVVVARGYRVVFEPKAVVLERSLTTTRDEWRMRIRVALQCYHALWHMRRVLNPLRHGIFAWQTLIHKVLRYQIGAIQLALLVCNLALLGQGPLYQGLFWAQAAFYGIAACGLVVERLRLRAGPMRYPYYLCLLNFASLLALLKFLGGAKYTTWTPRMG